METNGESSSSTREGVVCFETETGERGILCPSVLMPVFDLYMLFRKSAMLGQAQ